MLFVDAKSLDALQEAFGKEQKSTTYKSDDELKC